jgi:hypothetical protein
MAHFLLGSVRTDPIQYSPGGTSCAKNPRLSVTMNNAGI